MHKTFSDFGGTTYNATCLSYPDYLESEKADIPNYYKEHIQVFEDYWAQSQVGSSPMSAFVLQVLTCGLGFGIGYLFNKASLKLWRLFVGFFVGFVVSWLAGIVFWGSLFMPNDKAGAIVNGMPKSFLFAI